jgi:tetratricopeptide (TPR) repeat protein
MRAWMYTRAAIVSLHFRTPASALALADKAAALHRVPSGAAVRTQLVRARALVHVGDRVKALDALRQAQKAFESLDGSETSNNVFGYPERQFLVHAASAMTRLRDTRAARRLHDHALAAYEPTERMDPAFVRIDQGLCLLWESDPAQACRHVIDTIAALPIEHRSELVKVYARTFVAALTREQQRLREAMELREFLQSAFSMAPA